jgi:C_GCAxxG_C_C family probable redox protein
MAENIAEKAYELGKQYEQDFRGCSQCVLAALQDVTGLRNDDIFKAATGLSGGGGSATDGSCGAYSGAILMLSRLWGRDRGHFDDTQNVRARTQQMVRKFHDHFIQEYGSVVCRDIQTKLLGRFYYLADPEEAEKFHNAGAHSVHCPEVVGKAARRMVEIIQEEDLLPRPE